MNLLRTRHPLAWNGSIVRMLGLTVAVLLGLFLTQLSLAEAAAFVGLLTISVGTLIEPFIGLGAALFLGPLKAYLTAEAPQIPAQIGHALVVLALTSWLIRKLSQRQGRGRENIDSLRSPLLLAFLGFFGAVLLSLWDAVGLVTYGIPESIKWAEILLLFVFVKEHLTASDASSAAYASSHADPGQATGRLQWLVFMLLGGGLFQALVGVWQFGLRGEGPEHFRILGGEFFRAYGTFEQPNPYAGYLGLTAALALGIALDTTRTLWASWHARRSASTDDPRQPGSRLTDQPTSLPLYLFSGGALGVMLVALLASWSRGGWMGFGAATLAITAALPRKPVWSILLVALLIIGGLGLYASGQLPASFAARLTSFVQDIRLEDIRGVPINDANYAVLERLAHWQAAVSMLRHNLWTGVGFGCYEAAYPGFALINWPIALGHAHNIYLNLLAETGVIGLATYLGLWGVVFWQTLRVTRRARGLVRSLALGLLGAWTHLTVHHLLDNLFVNNVHLHIGVLLGVAACLIQETDRTTAIHHG